MHILPNGRRVPDTDPTIGDVRPVSVRSTRDAGVEPSSIPSGIRAGRALQPSDVVAKLENAIVALEHVAAETEQLAGGRVHAHGRLRARLKQSASPFADLRTADVLTLPPADRWRLGLKLGVQLSKVVTRFPRALEVLEGAGKGGKAAELQDALQRVLEELAQKLDSVPIASPELAPLLGDPPRIDRENAGAILEKLQAHLAAQPDGEVTAEQRLAALFLTDSIADELKSALKASGADPSPVTELVKAGRSRRERIALRLKKAGVVAVTAAVTIPAFLGVVKTDAPSATPVTPGNNVATAPANQPAPTEEAAPVPNVDPAAVHDPISIRVAEAVEKVQRERELTRRSIERATEEQQASDPAGVPEGLVQETVVEHLEAAGFAPKKFEGAVSDPEIEPLEQAVATFQESAGLEPTGVVTPETWSELEDSIIVADPNNVAFSPPQTEGERSDAVKRSEQVMAELNLLPAERVDGVFDEATQRGSRAYEDAHPGLGKDGAIDMEQFRSMIRDLIGKHTAKPETVSRPSPNQTPRYGVDVDTIVLHHTASNSTEGDLATLRSPAAEVSAHYLIGRDGTIFELVPEENQAWHAGVSALRGQPDVNARSIGIEITNDGSGHTPFTPGQYEALRRLVPYLVAKHDIPIENIVGHKDVALPQGRKSDPAANFDTARVLDAVHRLEQLEKLA